MMDKWKKINGYTNGYQIVVVGIPVDEVPEDDPLYHSCDAMGCSSIEHVLARIPVMHPTPYLMTPPKPPVEEE